MLVNQLYRKKEPQYEENSGMSQTVPDQGLTVRQILERYGNGTLGQISQREVNYSEDLPDMRFMDAVEQKQMYDSVTMEIEEKQNFLKDLHAKNEQKKRGRPKKETSVVENEEEG